jgi:hypothetical protein
MTRSTIVLFLAVTLTLGGQLLFSSRADAVVVCQKGSKIKLRADACKKKETTVADLSASMAGPAGAKGDKGDQGPKGDMGERGLAGSGEGLRIVDSTGKEVGLVVGEFYGDGASVVRRVSVPGGPGPEWFQFFVDGSGFQVSHYYGYYDGFATAGCTGARFTPTGGTQSLALGVTVQQDGKTGRFARPSEEVEGQYYRRNEEFGFTTDEAEAQCTQHANVFDGLGLGVVIKTVSCDRGPSGFCTDCCRPICATIDFDNQTCTPGPSKAAAYRTLDVSTFGLTPPFRLE